MAVDYRLGDTRDVIATIPDGSVSLVACSPPFLALRSYLPAGHPDKHAEIGIEPDPGTFLDTLLALTADWGRVLAPWGSIAIELGDTFAGTNASTTGTVGNLGGETRREVGSSHKYAGVWANPGFGDGFKGGNPGGDGWPRAKCLALIPQLYATSLAYGRNILTGEPSPAGQWLVRNMIVWHRPNPAVGALGDKFRPCTSYITVATRSPKRWFDLTAVRGDAVTPQPSKRGSTEFERAGNGKERKGTVGMDANPAGAPPLDAWFDEHDTWTVTTQPSSLAHYAMWPAKLAERLILSMCPAEVCATCGEPRRRMERIPHGVRRDELKAVRGHGVQNGEHAQAMEHGRATKVPTTVGWTDCGCGDGFTPGVVLDPFCGSATTMCVAELHGRDSIGIDIDPRNRELMPRRMEEVSRNLFGTKREVPGQIDLFADGAA